MTAASTTLTYTGCNASSTPTPSSLTVGDSSAAFDNISIAGFGTCTIELDVTVAADGTYKNTTSNLLINESTDTGSYGEDTLVASSGAPGFSGCALADKVTMASWDFSSQAVGSLSDGPFNAETKDADVGWATASQGNGATSHSVYQVLLIVLLPLLIQLRFSLIARP
ncbi:hypothetical protein VT98_10505, partial [Candidatus Electrothrix communis]